MKKSTIAILTLCAVLVWRECIHASRYSALARHYTHEIAQIQDETADTCNDKTTEAYAQGFEACLAQF